MYVGSNPSFPTICQSSMQTYRIVIAKPDEGRDIWTIMANTPSLAILSAQELIPEAWRIINVQPIGDF